MTTTINVKVNRKQNIQVTANSSAGLLSTDKSVVTLKNVNAVGLNRLDTMSDVDASAETTGAVPVYDENSDRYIVKKITFGDVVGDLDGGTF